MSWISATSLFPTIDIPTTSASAEDFVREIYSQAILADRIGMNSAWIGEHHFNLLGVNACPNMLLAQLAGATKNIRLAPAVVLLPVHHPLHVAEEWATLDLLSGGRVDFSAGRGYDRAEYLPFQADFENSSEMFAEGLGDPVARLDRARQVVAQGQVLAVRQYRGAAAAGAEAAAALRGLLLAAQHGAGGKE